MPEAISNNNTVVATKLIQTISLIKFASFPTAPIAPIPQQLVLEGDLISTDLLLYLFMTKKKLNSTKITLTKQLLLFNVTTKVFRHHLNNR
jgi:hypothetical protein